MIQTAKLCIFLFLLNHAIFAKNYEMNSNGIFEDQTWMVIELIYPNELLFPNPRFCVPDATITFSEEGISVPKWVGPLCPKVLNDAPFSNNIYPLPFNIVGKSFFEVAFEEPYFLWSTLAISFWNWETSMVQGILRYSFHLHIFAYDMEKYQWSKTIIKLMSANFD